MQTQWENWQGGWVKYFHLSFVLMKNIQTNMAPEVKSPVAEGAASYTRAHAALN